MKKTKIGLALLVVLVVLYVGVAWWTGMRTQTLLEQSVEHANQRIKLSMGAASNPPQVSISDYQRGVFASSLRYTVELGAAVETPQSTLQMQVDVHHGPFPWALLRRGEWVPQMVYAEAQLLPTAFTQPWIDLAGERAVRAEARLDFAQNGSADLIVAPLVLKKDGDELRFSGGQVHMTLRNGLADSEASGDFAALDVLERGEERVRLRDLRITGQSHQGEATAQSDSRVEVASVLIDIPGVDAIQLERFGMDIRFNQAATLADYAVVYRAGATRVGDRNFGAMDLGFSAKRIDIPAVMALAQVLDQMEKTGAPDLDALGTHLGALLQAQPTFALEPLRWKTDTGESRASVSTDLFAAQDGVALDELFDEMGFLRYLRQAQLQIDVSRAMALDVASQVAGETNPIAHGILAMMFDQYAAQLQAAGLVRIDGDKVSVNATFRNEDESVELNGQRMPIMDFVMLLAQLR